MTQSGVQPLVPDTSKTNYIEPLDFTASLEENSKSNIADFTRYIDGMIAQTNAMNKIAESKNKQLIELTGQGVAWYRWNQQRIETDKYVEAWTSAGANIETRWKQDLEQANVEAQNNLVDIQENKNEAEVELISKQYGLNSTERRDLIPAAAPSKSHKYNLEWFSNRIPALTRQAEAGLQFKDRNGNWTTITNVRHHVDYEIGQRAIRHFILQQGLSISDKKRLVRGILIPAMQKNETAQRNKWERNQAAAFDAATNNRRKYEFAEAFISKDGSIAFDDQFALTRGKYWLGGDKYDNRATREDVVDQTVTLLEEDRIGGPEVEKLLGSIPDYPPGNRESKNPKTWEDLHERDAKKIRAALNTQGQRKNENRELEAQNLRNRDWYNTEKDWRGKEVTPKMVKDKEKWFQDNHGVVPEPLKRLLVMMDAEPREAYRELEQQAALGIPIEDSQVWGITDPEWQKKALELQNSGITTAARKEMNEFLEPVVRSYGSWNYGKGDHMPLRATTVLRNATKIYSKEYRKQRLLGQDHGQAVEAAEKKVLSVINADAGSPERISLETRHGQNPINEDAPKSLAKSIEAVQKDYTVIDLEKPLPGEEAALKLAAKFYAQGGRVPDYYIQLAKHLKNYDAKSLMDHRWKLSGGKISQTKSEKAVSSMSVKDQNNLNNFPTPSKTLLTYVDNEDNASKLLEISKSEVAEANGGYDYILSPTGGDAHLEKPLTEHTVDEVISLVENGHTNIGMYDLSRKQLIDALNGTAEDWTLDTPFDSNFQDKLIKGLLRTRSNQSSISTGIDVSWRGLVNIDEESKLEYQKLTGITAPYLQLDTMPVEIATVVLNETMTA